MITLVKISCGVSDIRSWSFGEVKKRNHPTAPHRPERDGLFCERISAPKRIGNARKTADEVQGMICDRCGGRSRTVASAASGWGTSSLRPWSISGSSAMPSRLGNLLDMKTSSWKR